MFARLPALFLVLSLLNVTLAWAPRAPTTPTTPTVQSYIQSRQNSKEKMIRRATAKRARVQIKSFQEKNKDVFARGQGNALEPRSSPKVYPQCPGSHGLGYAHYASWDYYSNDIPGNPRYADPNTEENCIMLCNEHQVWSAPEIKRNETPDTSCIGVTYIQDGPCYLKGEEYQYGTFQSGGADISTDLVGGCAAWAGVVPPEMDAICCEL